MPSPDWTPDLELLRDSLVGPPPTVAHLLEPLTGMPVWGGENEFSSNLHFQAGAPHLIMTEVAPGSRRAGALQRSAWIRGDWHLWIHMCHWRASSRDVFLQESQSPTDAARDGRKLLGSEIVESTKATHRWVPSDEETLIAHSKSTSEEIARAASLLSGQILESIELVPKSAITLFRFDLGGLLWTWPYGTSAEDEDAWVLWCPGDLILSVNGDATFQLVNGGVESERRSLW